MYVSTAVAHLLCRYNTASATLNEQVGRCCCILYLWSVTRIVPCTGSADIEAAPMPMGVMRMNTAENSAYLRRPYPASRNVHAREMPSMPCSTDVGCRQMRGAARTC